MNGPKVSIVDVASQADYKVCFVDHDSQQKNHKIIEGGKLVLNASQAEVKVAIVSYASQATILITHKNFPK